MTLALPLRGGLYGKSESIEVLLFLATECPISNRYMPEINRLAASYRTAGLRWQVLLPEPGLQHAKAEHWAKEYRLELPWKLDASKAEARRAGATMTPEAAVFCSGKLVYRGRIDDRYVSWGKARVSPARRDLSEVLDSCLTGKAPAFRSSKSWGCYIESRKG